MPVHYPEKIKMTNTHLEDVKYFMPALDLTKTKNEKLKGNYNNNNFHSKNNNSQNTKANTEDITLCKKRHFQSEEWLKVMNAVGLTEEEMERFFKNKFFAKIIDAIDTLIGIVVEKSTLIAQVQYDKSILNNQIAVCKKENNTLMLNFIEYKEKLKAYEEKTKKGNMDKSTTKDADADKDNNELNSSLVINKNFNSNFLR